MTQGSGTQIQSGISSQITTLPAAFTHRTALAYGQGINDTIAAWGQALTDLTGKKRPSNDADVLLKSISYWTDNGATYYYNAGGPSYTDTLRAIKAEFLAKGISPGSLQLDSWWYPKGPDNAWSSHGGIWTYAASTAIFQPTLAAFQTSLGLPLTAHARWIDAASPYQGKYKISGGVATDPQYWADTATYLHSSGVTTYEQDWLGTNAQTLFNLTDPAAFMDNMAAAMSKQGINMQYCMATPKHFLQSTNYNNVMSARTSQDGFDSTRWTEFLYGSRLAAALGIWPFSDVFMSTDRDGLLLATLSAGPVGIGDHLGGISAEGLLQSVRPDGVIVKPDVPITPVDSAVIGDAQGRADPMVAATYSDFGGALAHYIFAYPRGANTQVTIAPAIFGITGTAYLYDYLHGSGYLIAANDARIINLTDGLGYFVLVPVGKAGIAFLGDKGNFVTLGKQRIPELKDGAEIVATVSYAASEEARTLFGYSAKPVSVRAMSGSAETAVWDPTTQIFTVKVHASNAGTARLRIGTVAAAAASGSRTGSCGAHCRPEAGQPDTASW
jgi:hypothetical protein